MSEYLIIKRISPKIIILPPLNRKTEGHCNSVCVKVGEMVKDNKEFHLLFSHPADHYPEETEAGPTVKVPMVWAREK